MVEGGDCGVEALSDEVEGPEAGYGCGFCGVGVCVAGFGGVESFLFFPFVFLLSLLCLCLCLVIWARRGDGKAFGHEFRDVELESFGQGFAQGDGFSTQDLDFVG